MTTTGAKVADFKVGDWVIAGYDVVQIKIIEDDYLTVSNGSVSTSGRLDLYPLTLRNKAAADFAQAVRDRFRSHCLGHILNWADIHQLLVAIAAEIYTANDDEASNKAYSRLLQLSTGVLENLNSLSRLQVEGVKLLNYSRANY